MEIKKVVYKEISELMGIHIEDIKDSSHLVNDLEMDSLDVVELLMFIENKLNITIDDEKFGTTIPTVENLIKFIEDEQVQ